MNYNQFSKKILNYYYKKDTIKKHIIVLVSSICFFPNRKIQRNSPFHYSQYRQPSRIKIFGPLTSTVIPPYSIWLPSSLAQVVLPPVSQKKQSVAIVDNSVYSRSFSHVDRHHHMKQLPPLLGTFFPIHCTSHCCCPLNTLCCNNYKSVAIS